MFTIAVWNLGTGRKPGSAQLPQVLRRVGCDVVTLANHTASNTDAIARNCGYRHRAKLLSEAIPVAILAKVPLSDAEVQTTPFGIVASANVHLPHGPVHVVMGLISPDQEDAAAAYVAEELASTAAPILLTGSLGHDLANPRGPWGVLRGELVDLVEVSGGHPSGARAEGVLGRGVEVRGAGTLRRAGGGDAVLTWARFAL
jgi:hypothetical protein